MIGFVAILKSRRYLQSRANSRPGDFSTRPLAATIRFTSSLILGQPKVFCVSDDRNAIGKDNLIAGSSFHNFTNANYVGRPTALVKNQVAWLEVPHGAPTAGSRNWGRNV